MKTIRWGVLGCGNIARKFCDSVTAVDGAEVAACASRTPGKAGELAEEFDIRFSFDSYQDLVTRNDVDAVYVATTHNFHCENVLLCLEHGKHVLCEKPLAVTAQEAERMVESAESKGLFLMEAMWTRFLPAVQRMKQWLDAGEIGEVRTLRADFCFRTDFNSEGRLFNPDLAGGALLDTGIYPVSMASFIMGQQPEEVVALADVGSTGVDEQSLYGFAYGNGALGLLSSAVRSRSENRLEICGTEGRLVLPSHFLASEDVELHRFNGETIRERHPYHGPHGFRFEIEAACEAIRSGETDCAVMPQRESVRLADTMDRIRRAFEANRGSRATADSTGSQA